MKKFTVLITSLVAGLCLAIIPNSQPIMASDTPLTINIPDGKDAKVTNNTIKLNTESDGSITFAGETTANATVKIIKHGGNNRHYTIQADDNGNFTKTLKLASNTKKCKFEVTANNDHDEKSDKTKFNVTNTSYVKPEESSSSSFNDTASSLSNESSSVTGNSTSQSTTGDMRTDQAGMIVGNSRSKIYHTPDQQGYHMNSANAVYFNTEAEAQAAGYRKSLR